MGLFGFALGFEARAGVKLTSPVIQEHEFEGTTDAKEIRKQASRNNYETREPENKDQ